MTMPAIGEDGRARRTGCAVVSEVTVVTAMASAAAAAGDGDAGRMTTM